MSVIVGLKNKYSLKVWEIEAFFQASITSIFLIIKFLLKNKK